MFYLLPVKPFLLFGTDKKFWGLWCQNQRNELLPNLPWCNTSHGSSAALSSQLAVQNPPSLAQCANSSLKHIGLLALVIHLVIPWQNILCASWEQVFAAKDDFSEVPWLMWTLFPPTGNPCASHPLSSLAHNFLHGYFVPGSFPFTKHLPVEETFAGVVLNFSQLP